MISDDANTNNDDNVGRSSNGGGGKTDDNYDEKTKELDKMDYNVDSADVREEPNGQNHETYLSLESQNGGIRNSEVGEREISQNIHTKPIESVEEPPGNNIIKHHPLCP